MRTTLTLDEGFEYDFSSGELGRYARRPGEGLDIRVDEPSSTPFG